MGSITDVSLGGVIGISAGQFLAGNIVGSAVDFVFPEPNESKGWFATSVEAALQIMLGAVASVAVSKGFSSILLDKSDPSGGIAYIICFYISQPKLLKKLNMASMGTHKFYGSLVSKDFNPSRMTTWMKPFADSLHTL